MRQESELRAIRAVVAQELDTARGDGRRTVDLVRRVVEVAKRRKGTLATVRQRLVAVGVPNRPSIVTMLEAVLTELAGRRATGVEATAQLTALHALLAAAGVERRAVARPDHVPAGFTEAMIGEDGRVEVALTEGAVSDLALTGAADLEVGDGDGHDVLLRIVDLTGWLRQLGDAVRVREARRATEGREGQRGQQQPDRRDGEAVEGLTLSDRAEENGDNGDDTTEH